MPPFIPPVAGEPPLGQATYELSLVAPLLQGAGREVRRWAQSAVAQEALNPVLIQSPKLLNI